MRGIPEQGRLIRIIHLPTRGPDGRARVSQALVVGREYRVCPGDNSQHMRDYGGEYVLAPTGSRSSGSRPYGYDVPGFEWEYADDLADIARELQEALDGGDNMATNVGVQGDAVETIEGWHPVIRAGTVIIWQGAPVEDEGDKPANAVAIDAALDKYRDTLKRLLEG